MAGTLVVNITAGVPRRVWCDECLTTAGYEIDMLILSESGVSVVGTCSGCRRCGPKPVVKRR